MKVIKRDGRQVEFDIARINDAILKAFESVDGEITVYAKEKARDIAKFILNMGQEYDTISVEEIQDIVEQKLMNSNRKDVARAYVIYRNERSKERERRSKLIQDISDKLLAKNVQNQNANVDEHSFGGRMGEANSVVMKKYALDYCMSDMAKNNHLNNEIYIHDLDSYAIGSHNCLSIPFDKLLANGFNTRQTDVRPAQSASTAFQLTAVIFQLQSLQQFGGVSATHYDHTMVPYVRKSFFKHYKDGYNYILNQNFYDFDFIFEPEDISIDDKNAYHNDKVYKYALDMTEREVYQGVEALYHNLNTLQSRSGNQLPFTSINYGTCTEPEGRMVTKAMLEVSINGLGGKHRTPIFPCGIFQCIK